MADDDSPVRHDLAVRATVDRAQLRRFLERDRLYSAYALCDLDAREFDRTRWGAAFASGEDEPSAVVLEYNGPAPQPVFVMGDNEGVAAILRLLIRPRAAYIACQSDHCRRRPRLSRDDGPEWSHGSIGRLPSYPGGARLRRSRPGPQPALPAGFTAWLPPSAIAEGAYYGIRVGGRLVAAAGTHVISPEARLGVVCNVMTQLEYRGRGYATATTGAVTAELLRSCDQVVLNVRADNPPAIQAYRRLGYREHLRFEERLVHRLGGAPMHGLPDRAPRRLPGGAPEPTTGP
jgi:ribosomal protein S18 acetylase RimI-like enzyme